VEVKQPSRTFEGADMLTAETPRS